MAHDPYAYDDEPAQRWPSRVAWVLLAVLAGVTLLMGIPDREMTPEEAAVERHVRAVRVALAELRAAVADYRQDHGTWPGVEPGNEGHGQGEAAWFERHLTMASDIDGAVAPSLEERFPYGPYLPYGIPANPVNGRRTVRMLAPGDEPAELLDGSGGWLYDPTTGQVHPDAPGETAEAGLRYLDL